MLRIDRVRRAILEDLRFSARTLIKDRSFAALAIVSLMLGIGSSTAVFSVVNEVLLRPLPYRDPGQLVAIRYRTSDPRQFDNIPSSSYDAWQAGSRTFQSLASVTTSSGTLLTIGDEHFEISTGSISRSLLSTLGATGRPTAGRLLVDADHAAGAPPVAMVAHRFWRGALQSDPSMIGKDVVLFGRPYTVIGVASPQFRLPARSMPDVVIPLTTPSGRGVVVRYFDVVGRLQDDLAASTAAEELAAIDMAARASYPAAVQSLFAAGGVPEVVPLQRFLAGDLRDMLVIAFAAVSLVFLMACANVAGLLVARAASRRTELAMRVALGASPLRLMQMLLAEALLLSVAGAAAATAVVYVARGALQSLVARNGLPSATIAIDWPVLLFAAVLAVVAALLSGLLPTIRLLRAMPSMATRAAGTGTIRASSSDRLRRVLVAAQMAAAFTVLIGAVLLLNSFWRLAAKDLGFEPANVFSFRISLVGGGYSPAQRQALAGDLFERLEAVPGILSAGAGTVLPLAGQSFGFSVPIEGGAPWAADEPMIAVDLVSPGFFRTLGVAMAEGRDVDRPDGADAPPVAIVNQAFVRERFPAGDALGRRISLGGGPQDATITIVGIVKDVWNRRPREQVVPHVYRPFAQAAPQITWGTLRGVVRITSGEVPLAETVRREVTAIARQAAVYDFAMMTDRVSETVTPDRHRATIFGILAIAAVVLAAVGLYGLLAYFVLQSRHELGVRMALGASKSGLVGLIARRALRPVLVGIGIGAIGSFWFARALENLLYGVRPIDPATFAAAAAGLLLVAVAATCVPAWRAAQADPMVALRAE